MNELLLRNLFPGATSCILIGEPGADVSADLRHYRHALWFTDAEGARADSASLSSAATQHIIVDASPAPDFASLLARFIGKDPRHLPSLYVTRTVLERSQSAFEGAIEKIHAILQEQHQARETRQKDGFIWQRHLFQNVIAYAQQRLPAAWKGALTGLPAFVCGAGPSLDVSAPRLAAAAGCGIVFAADSALRTLARHGVAADFAVSIDAAKLPAKCLPPGAPPTRVILANTSPPEWRDALPPETGWFVSGNQLTEDWLDAQGVARTAICAQENCGATALELARFLGCAPIYVFGIDLAVDAARPAQRHAADADAALYRDSGYNPDQHLPIVPGNYAASVPTFAPGDWRALSTRIAGWPAGLVFNVTDRGARLSNTTLVRPEHFVLATSAGEKSAALARLATPARLGNATATLAVMRDTGRRATRLIEPLRASLGAAGPPAAAKLFRHFFGDPDVGRILGAFSFKLMPHLLPPVEDDASLWHSLIEEFAVLAQTAASINPD